MKNCDNCINHHPNSNKFCSVMSEKPSSLFCWADKKMQLERERDCLAYSVKVGVVDAIRKSKARINALNRKEETK